MHCPFCQSAETKVIDSRLVTETNQVRRRRQCLVCEERFTSYEVAEITLPNVIKSDGTRVPFSEEKLRKGMIRALEKRPVRTEDIDSAISRILQKLRTCGEKDVRSEYIGECCMDALKQLDHVAYVRFASVYRCFQDVNAFREAIDNLEEK